MLTIYFGTSTVGITTVVNPAETGPIPSPKRVREGALTETILTELLRANAQIEVAKVSVMEGRISVTAQLPVASVDKESLKACIGHVLGGAGLVRALFSDAVSNVAPEGQRGVPTSLPPGPTAGRVTNG